MTKRQSVNARDVIAALTITSCECRSEEYWECEHSLTMHADMIIAELDAAGFVIVPKEPPTDGENVDEK